MRGILILFLVFNIPTLLDVVTGEEGAEESDDSYHMFECSESNKNEHFERMAQYMSHIIPILEMMAEQAQSTGDEHKKHKMDIKALVGHFKNYNHTKEELRIKCDDNSTAIEDCCKQIVELEKKFHDEMTKLSSEEQASK